jgi:hypothetical protein
MASKTKRATRPLTLDQLKKDAELLFKVINNPATPDDAREEIVGWTDEIYNLAKNVPNPLQDKKLFVRTFVDGMQNAGRARARQHVMRIVDGLREGQEPAAIAAWFEQERARLRAESEEEARTQPEPKDRLSDEWRYWKLSQFDLAFKSKDASVRERAWKEFESMFKTLIKRSDLTVYDVKTLLPYIIVIQQRLEGKQRGGASDAK